MGRRESDLTRQSAFSANILRGEIERIALDRFGRFQKVRDFGCRTDVARRTDEGAATLGRIFSTALRRAAETRNLRSRTSNERWRPRKEVLSAEGIRNRYVTDTSSYDADLCKGCCFAEPPLRRRLPSPD
jgi:hypothetical protein